jgi:hypothetical protein
MRPQPKRYCGALQAISEIRLEEYAEHPLFFLCVCISNVVWLGRQRQDVRRNATIWVTAGCVTPPHAEVAPLPVPVPTS